MLVMTGDILPGEKPVSQKEEYDFLSGLKRWRKMGTDQLQNMDVNDVICMT